MTFTERLKELMGRATPGPWTVWTSCSFRRITHKADGDVISGCVHPIDGHHDLRAKESDLELLCLLRNHAPALLKLAEAAEFVNALSIQTDAHKQLRAALRELDGAGR